MKKKMIFAVLSLTVAAIFAGCGGKEPAAPASASDSVYVEDKPEVTSTEPEVVEEPDQGLPESAFIDAFLEAQDKWFMFEGGISTDHNDSIPGTINGFDTEFYRVNEPGISTMDDLINVLSENVDYAYVQNAVNTTESYVEQDGVLYNCPAGRGDDMTICWVEYSVDLNGDAGEVIVTIHRQDFFDALNDWYETGAIDNYSFPFTVVDSTPVFDEMYYLCGGYYTDGPEAGHDADSLEAALLALLEGKWVCTTDDTYYEIQADGTFSYCIDSEASQSGYIVSSRSNDGSYMMGGEDFSNTFFTLSYDDTGAASISFSEGSIVYIKE